MLDEMHGMWVSQGRLHGIGGDSDGPAPADMGINKRISVLNGVKRKETGLGDSDESALTEKPDPRKLVRSLVEIWLEFLE